MSYAALLPWGMRQQLALVSVVFLAVLGNAFALGAASSDTLRFHTLIPLLVLLGACVFSSGVLHSTRLRAAREELLRLRAEAETRALNQRLEERVAQRTAELQQTTRELERFTFSVAHDLRAPLRSMAGFSAAVVDDYGPSLSEVARDYLGRIQSAAQRLGRLLDDLLGLSQVNQAQMRHEAVDLSAMAVAIEKRLQGRDPDAHVQFVIHDGMVADGDQRFLEIAVGNLLDNAWKFSRHGDSPRIEMGVLADDAGRRYFVSDNGIGFDMRYASKLFSAFERLRAADNYEGTGIGLTTVRRIIEQHRGRVWAEGKPGEGATFYFTLG